MYEPLDALSNCNEQSETNRKKHARLPKSKKFRVILRSTLINLIVLFHDLKCALTTSATGMT